MVSKALHGGDGDPESVDWDFYRSRPGPSEHSLAPMQRIGDELVFDGGAALLAVRITRRKGCPVYKLRGLDRSRERRQMYQVRSGLGVVVNVSAGGHLMQFGGHFADDDDGTAVGDWLPEDLRKFRPAPAEGSAEAALQRTLDGPRRVTRDTFELAMTPRQVVGARALLLSKAGQDLAAQANQAWYAELRGEALRTVEERSELYSGDDLRAATEALPEIFPAKWRELPEWLVPLVSKVGRDIRPPEVRFADLAGPRGPRLTPLVDVDVLGETGTHVEAASARREREAFERRMRELDQIKAAGALPEIQTTPGGRKR